MRALKRHGSGLLFRLIVVIGVALFPESRCWSQLFPGLEGEELVTAIRAEFTPHQLLTETQVKDTLYANVFLLDDSVRCIYSDLARFLPDGVDPSQWLYGTGQEPGSINLEHSWPQANGAGKGTDGNRNMHHLFPSRSEINSIRGNYPFGEIVDFTAEKWFYHAQELHAVPGSGTENYSEYKTGLFEPREEAKGDIARALMYFWTIYREDAIQAAPLFFEEQRQALCQWHEQDPVDDFEMMRTLRIAGYQDGKANPFILDCSLAKRAYCGSLGACEMVGTNPLPPEKAALRFDAQENSLLINDETTSVWDIRVLDTLGRLLVHQTLESNQLSSPILAPPGIYLVLASSQGRRLYGQFFIR